MLTVNFSTTRSPRQGLSRLISLSVGLSLLLWPFTELRAELKVELEPELRSELKTEVRAGLNIAQPGSAAAFSEQETAETAAEQTAMSLVERVEMNLGSATPAWLGKPDKAHFARFIVRHYERKNALAELYALVAEQPSSHYSALFTRVMAYQLLHDAGYFCAQPQSSDDFGAAAYLLWLHGDLQKADWTLLEQAKSACKAEPMIADVAAGLLEQTPEHDDTQRKEVFGDELDAAIVSFQQRHNLQPNGNLDSSTLASLTRSPEQLIAQLHSNLKRMRTLNGQLSDRYLLANIPAFEAKVFHHDRAVLSLNTIVGKTSRPTPEFSSELTTVVVNPSWNVPKKLVYKDLIPKQLKDADYLSSRGIGVYTDTGRGAEALDPAALDWRALRHNFPYHMRQSPGPRNALGRYKFITPNPRAIFMHDTNARKLFEKEVRAFSSGCVRLEQPIRLVEYLLNYQGSSQLLSNVPRLKSTKWISLKDKLPVHYVYWTAWVDEFGQLQLRNDIYKQDKTDLKALQFAAR